LDGLPADVQLEVAGQLTVGIVKAARHRFARSAGDRAAYDTPCDAVEEWVTTEIPSCGSPGRSAPPGIGGKQTMTPFRTLSFTWWQVGLLKFSLLALGLAIGSMWPAVFVRWRDVLLVLFVGPVFCVTYVWLKQLRSGARRAKEIISHVRMLQPRDLRRKTGRPVSARRGSHLDPRLQHRPHAGSPDRREDA
jgi:hypothetical protein